jgi:TRAP-type C4-dicarboxylate transport system permease small subunit
MIRNEFICFVMELSPGKKMTEALHHALHAMMQIPVIFLFFFFFFFFFWGGGEILHHQTNKNHSLNHL